MIGKLKGKVDFLGNGFIILDVNDVGYKIFVPSNVYADLKTGDEIILYIHTHVKEDILALYGFSSYNELAFYELLLGVSGVGPKAGLNIVSAISYEKIENAISKQDPTVLYAVSGIGKKTAEKIVIELKNKVGVLAEGNIFAKGSESEDIIVALEGLGYSRHEINLALSNIGEGNVEERLKEAMKVLRK